MKKCQDRNEQRDTEPLHSILLGPWSGASRQLGIPPYCAFVFHLGIGKNLDSIGVYKASRLLAGQGDTEQVSWSKANRPDSHETV